MKLRENKIIEVIIISIISMFLYFILAYQIKRENTLMLFCSIAAAFVIYVYLLGQKEILLHGFNYILFLAFSCRIIFIFSIPALSDDYFRFIWDGRSINSGINPFAYLPDYIREKSMLTGVANVELYNNMNSPHYYSVYPPILQAIFFISAKLSFNNNIVAILILRIFILLAEFGTYIYLKKVIIYLNLNKEKIFWYLLNPLVIIELSGNLHFEGVMLFFATAALYYLLINNLIYSSILLALAVWTKMIPLILLPLIVMKLGFKNGAIYSIIVLAIGAVLFLPFIDNQLISNIGNSVGLYFQKFEFNASIYYILRWIGFEFTGYNTIGIIGKILPLISLVFILIISYGYKQNSNDRDFFNSALTILFVYYLFALIVHPWYISFLVLMSVFSGRRFALIWSALILGSYLTYSSLPYKENLWVVMLEYSIVLTVFIFEQIRVKTLVYS